MRIGGATEGHGDDVIAVAVVEQAEAMILVSLADQLQALLADSLESDPAADSAVQRLLPDAYRDDPELAEEWRRFSRRGLVDRKISFARSLSTALAPGIDDNSARTVPLARETALDWVRGIGDLRLVIADRMGIAADGDEGTFAEPGLRDVYDLLAWMQDALVHLLESADSGDSP